MYKYFLFFLLIIGLNGTCFSQQIVGTITDLNNNLLPSVNVSIEGTRKGVISDQEGQFSIKVKENRSEIVVFSCIGYDSEKIRLPLLKRNQTYELNIKLKEMDLRVINDKDKYREDRKDDRTKLQATQQSELIEQRKNNTPPKNFESEMGFDNLGGFGLEQFEPR